MRPSRDDVLLVHAEHPLHEPRTALVLDSPHSGRVVPPDFDAAVPDEDLRDGEDCWVDELYQPAAALGIPLLAAQFPRTYLDANRHAADLDPELLAEPWPHELRESGKARIGKALLWRTLDDGRPLYARRLSVAEVERRIAAYHAPYHEALRALLDAAHRRHGVVVHLNCHSMNAVSGKMGEGGAGIARADIVLGDRDGSACAGEITAFVQERLAARGYDVRVNDPFKGVELVRAYSNPAAGRHSLQLEINKRLYMDEKTRQRTPHFDILQQQLMALLGELAERAADLGARP
jgi:N-formylglutamate amidohydrolase